MPSAEPPFELPPTQEVQRLKTAVIDTSKGRLILELYPEDAPWHVANLKYLADKGYYRGKPFHLFEQGFYIQTGASNPSVPESGVTWVLPPEFNAYMPIRGALEMARFTGENNPDRVSHGSQFHILLADRSEQRGRYTIFGQVIRGLEVLDQLRLGDTIQNITVYVRK